jgi:hypothetical protein
MSRALEPYALPCTAFGPQQPRILCATDLSVRCCGAVRAAGVLANRLGAQMTIAHVASACKARGDLPAAQGHLR